MNTFDNVLDRVVLINLDIHLWSGRRKLDRSDIKGDVPPETLASLGTKRLIDPKKVAPFDSLKRRAERLCAAKGIKIMGSYAIANDMIDEVEQELSEIQDEFYSFKRNFLMNYRQDVLTWVEGQGEWKNIILNAVVPPNRIEAQTQFDWQIYHVRPVAGDSREGGMTKKVETMGQQLVREISEEAQQIWEKSFLLKTKVSSRSLEPIKKLHLKLDSLSFLDQKADAMSGLMEKAINEVSHMPSIEGEKLMVLFGLLLILSDPAKFHAFGQEIIDGKKVGLRDLIDLNAKVSEENKVQITDTEAESIEAEFTGESAQNSQSVPSKDQSILDWF